MRCLVLYSATGPEAEGVLFSDGKIVLNQKGQTEIYPNLVSAMEAYQPERGWKFVAQPRV